MRFVHHNSIISNEIFGETVPFDDIIIQIIYATVTSLAGLCILFRIVWSFLELFYMILLENARQNL